MNMTGKTNGVQTNVTKSVVSNHVLIERRHREGMQSDRALTFISWCLMPVAPSLWADELIAVMHRRCSHNSRCSNQSLISSNRNCWIFFILFCNSFVKRAVHVLVLSAALFLPSKNVINLNTKTIITLPADRRHFSFSVRAKSILRYVSTLNLLVFVASRLVKL